MGGSNNKGNKYEQDAALLFRTVMFLTPPMVSLH